MFFDINSRNEGFKENGIVDGLKSINKSIDSTYGLSGKIAPWSVGNINMIFSVTNTKISYTRSIESMGEGLVLFKIKAIDKHFGLNYHYFFEDKKKPPLDLAINPINGAVEYVSFFAQDERLTSKTKNINLCIFETQIFFDTSNFTEECSTVSRFNEFELQKDELGNIWVLQKHLINDMKAYKITEKDFLLFDFQNEFAGILLKNISAFEYKELQTSKCIE